MEETDEGQWRRRVLVLTLVALALRLAFVLLEPETRPVADERTWTNWALNLVSEKVRFSPLRTHMIFYPPVYPYFLALPYELTGGFELAKCLQALLSALLIPVLASIGRRVYGAAAGWGAAVLAAVWPDLIWFSAHFWCETIYLTVLFGAMALVLRADAESKPRLAFLAGLLWGIGVLTRETGFYFTPLLGLWLLRPAPSTGRPRWALGALLVLGTVLVVAPWTARNFHQFGALVPVATAGGLNMFQGNCGLTRQETYDRHEAVQGRIEQYRFAMREGVRCVVERQPAWIFEKLRDELPNLWEADSLALIHIKRGAYGAVPPAAAIAAAVVVVLPFLLLLVPFLAGLLRPLQGPADVLLRVFLLYYTAIHIATHGFARYRLPVMPIAFLLAAWTWAEREAVLARLRSSRAAALALVAAVVAMAVVLTPSFRRNAVHPAFGLVPADTPAEDGTER